MKIKKINLRFIKIPFLVCPICPNYPEPCLTALCVSLRTPTDHCVQCLGPCLASLPPLSAPIHMHVLTCLQHEHALKADVNHGANLKRLIATCYLLNKIHTPCLYILGNCQLAFRELSGPSPGYPIFDFTILTVPSSP